MTTGQFVEELYSCESWSSKMKINIFMITKFYDSCFVSLTLNFIRFDVSWKEI